MSLPATDGTLMIALGDLRASLIQIKPTHIRLFLSLGILDLMMKIQTKSTCSHIKSFL